METQWEGYLSSCSQALGTSVVIAHSLRTSENLIAKAVSQYEVDWERLFLSGGRASCPGNTVEEYLPQSLVESEVQ